MANLLIPDGVPEDLEDYARRFSWDDAAQPLCLFEGIAMQELKNPERSARYQKQAEKMRTLILFLPFDWNPPPIDTKDFLKWMADEVRVHGIPR
jgi:hypothetical protein